MPAKRGRRPLTPRRVKTEEEKIIRVSYLPVVTCQVCGRKMAYQPGTASEVLTGHYQSDHAEES